MTSLPPRKAAIGERTQALKAVPFFTQMNDQELDVIRSVAVDKAGNVEATTDRADASTAGAIQLNQSTFYPIVPR